MLVKLGNSYFVSFVFPVADSSSDYSQRTSLDIPGLQQEIRATPEGARREADDALPDKIKVKTTRDVNSNLNINLMSIEIQIG